MASTPTTPSTQGYVPFETAIARISGAQLAFAVILLVVGCYLLVLGRRTWRLTCALSTGLAVELITFAITVSVTNSGGLNNSFSDASNDLALFGLVTSLGLVGVLFSFFLPERWYMGWGIGYLFLGALAGLSVGFGIVLLGALVDNTAGKWALCGVLAILGVVGVISTRWRGAMLSTCLIGAFLLAVGIDLIVNANRGTSFGLRKLLDENSLHAEALRVYEPPLSSKLLVGLSWLVALLFALFQELAFKNRPFLPTKSGLIFSRLPAEAASKRVQKPSTDLEKGGALSPITTPLDAPLASSAALPSAGAYSPGSHPASVLSGEDSQSGSFQPDSEIRRLTENYERALAALNDPNATYTDGTASSAREIGTVPPSPAVTTSVPIYYRPGTMHAMSGLPRDDDHSLAASGEDGLQRITSPRLMVRPDPDQHPELASLQRRHQQQQNFPQSGGGIPDIPDMVAAAQHRRPAGPRLLSAESVDRGTTYSVPMTNITSSEYGDRDGYRPPSWTGDLPWHPAMLRGNLDPATLPRHPPSEHEQEILHQRREAAPLPVPLPVPAEVDESDYDMIQHSEAQSGASRAISQPISMHAYASRPIPAGGQGSQPGPAAAILSRLSPREQTSLGNPTILNNRPILRATRTHSRDQTMFPADDDLPDQGHSRLNTSETAVEGLFSGEDDGDESTHASYSLHNFRKTPKTKRAEDGERPITQSDVTPMLQTLPEPGRPTLVHRDSPAQASQMASLTPAPSTMLLDTGNGTPRSEMGGSSATVRPSEEQRRSLAVAGAMGIEDDARVDDQSEPDGKVRFASPAGEGRGSASPRSRRTLRDRLFRR